MVGQIYAVASGKGGVGKTTTAVNLGVVLRQADHTVALVDADLGMANLATVLGVDSEATLHDVLAGTASVDEAVVEEAPGFGVLIGSTDLTSYPDADPRELRDVLETLAESYDFVIVDTGAGMSHEDVLPLGIADRILLVTTPDPAAIGDTRKTAELAGLADGDVAGLVVTMADGSTDTTYIGTQIGVEVVGVIPFDATVRESTAAGTPLEGLDPDSPAAAAYRDLGDVLAGATTEETTRTSASTSEEPDEATADEAADHPATEAEAAAESEPVADAEAAGPPPEASPDAEAETPATDEATDEPADADAAEAGAPAADDEPGPDEAEPAAEDEPEAATPADIDESPPKTGDEVDSDGADADDDSDEADADDDSDGADADDDSDEADADDDEDYLAEFEDDEPRSSGGLLAKLSRIFR